MKRIIAHLLLTFCLAGLVRADPTTQSVQQALKEQGVYYGNVTGQKSAETTAAIRRYQIRSGLQITGELNQETLHSLNSGSNSTASAQSTRKSAVTQSNNVPRDDSSRIAQNPPPASSQATASSVATQSNSTLPEQSAQLGQNPPPASSEPDRRVETNPIFSGAYFEPVGHRSKERLAVAEVQRQLMSRGYYWGRIDGRYGRGTALALRAFQLASGLSPTGRLDTSALAALGVSNENLTSLQSAPRQSETWVPITKFKHGKWKVKWKKYYREEGDEYGLENREGDRDGWSDGEDHGD